MIEVASTRRGACVLELKHGEIRDEPKSLVEVVPRLCILARVRATRCDLAESISKKDAGLFSCMHEIVH